MSKVFQAATVVLLMAASAAAMQTDDEGQPHTVRHVLRNKETVAQRFAIGCFEGVNRERRRRIAGQPFLGKDRGDHQAAQRHAGQPKAFVEHRHQDRAAADAEHAGQKSRQRPDRDQQ
jgi:hypothetical protein